MFVSDIIAIQLILLNSSAISLLTSVAIPWLRCCSIKEWQNCLFSCYRKWDYTSAILHHLGDCFSIPLFRNRRSNFNLDSQIVYWILLPLIIFFKKPCTYTCAYHHFQLGNSVLLRIFAMLAFKAGPVQPWSGLMQLVSVANGRRPRKQWIGGALPPAC